MIRWLAILLAVAAPVLLVMSGFGTHVELWSYRVGFALLRSSAYVGIAAIAAAILALAIPGWRAGRIAPLLIALVLGAATACVPLEFQRRARSVPPIHDISTDTGKPPEFVAIVPLRAGAPNPPQYDGAKVAGQQQQAYPDIRPLELALPPAQAFPKALAAAEARGWEIVAKDAAAGRIEAVATTPWFGFKDDVVIRVAATGTGSRIDVRSKSRLGRSDLGTNARRIRDFLQRLK